MEKKKKHDGELKNKWFEFSHIQKSKERRMWAHGPRWQHCFKRSAAGRAKSPSAARHGGNIKFQRGGSVSGADGDDQLSTQVWRNTSVNRKQWQRARELQDTRVWLSLHTELWKNIKKKKIYKNYSWWSDPCLHIFICLHVYICLHIFTYVYMCLYMFIFVFFSWWFRTIQHG